MKQYHCRALLLTMTKDRTPDPERGLLSQECGPRSVSAVGPDSGTVLPLLRHSDRALIPPPDYLVSQQDVQRKSLNPTVPDAVDGVYALPILLALRLNTRHEGYNTYCFFPRGK